MRRKGRAPTELRARGERQQMLGEGANKIHPTPTKPPPPSPHPSPPPSLSAIPLPLNTWLNHVTTPSDPIGYVILTDMHMRMCEPPPPL